jgi:tetratricopeptide (TPR) repeat protein
MDNLKSLLDECERLIRSGQIEQVHKNLSGVQPAKIPRELRLPAANICRRTGLITLGLKLLGPLIQTDKQGWRSEASSPELAEYAVLLHRSGAIQEALWVLGKVDPAQCPEVFLYQAFCLFGIWEYERAVISLEKFLRSPINAYQTLVGKVNLSAAMVALERRDEADEIIASILPNAKSGGFGRLHGNCLELRAQIHFQRGHFDQALGDLREASGAISAGRSIDHFLVRKWATIIDAMKSRNASPLITFRSEAISRGDWECVREMDRFALKIQFEQNRFDHLIFGTPFTPYREMIEYENPDYRASSEAFLIGDSSQTVLDLYKGKLKSSRRKGIEATQSVHRVIDALTRDFYRPLAIGGMFAELFEGEHFNVDSSIHRVHQSVYRTRQWIEENELPLVLLEQNGEYSLEVKRGFGILVPLERRRFQAETLRLEILRENYSTRDFVPREARMLLGISSTSLKALITSGLEAGTLLRSGAGRSTRYRFATNVKTPMANAA